MEKGLFSDLEVGEGGCVLLKQETGVNNIDVSAKLGGKLHAFKETLLGKPSDIGYSCMMREKNIFKILKVDLYLMRCKLLFDKMYSSR